MENNDLPRKRALERAWVEIDLDAIANNTRQIKARLDKGTKLMTIIKADGYGHGAAQIAPTMLENGADAVGVATCDEAVSLRLNGIDAPILLLGFTPPERYGEVMKYDLIQTIYSLESAKELSQAAKQAGKVVSVHIKVDTGMSRIGFLPTETAAKEIKQMTTLENISLDGMFTHFATSDCADLSYTYEQMGEFNNFVELLKNEGIEIPFLHVSNSGAIISCDLNLSMVRAGIMIYGLPPSDEVDMSSFNLQRALSFKAQISHVKVIEAGVSVGYSRKHYAKERSVIATIPVGYADGYARNLTNKGYVLVNGEKAYIVGGVCMDQIMIDVTHIKVVKVGDIAVLIGRQDNLEITADELGALYSTINYEVVCAISKRVPRYYLQNNKVVKIFNGVLYNN